MSFSPYRAQTADIDQSSVVEFGSAGSVYWCKKKENPKENFESHQIGTYIVRQKA